MMKRKPLPIGKTCNDCEWCEVCTLAVIDPKELCYSFRPKQSEVDTE